MSAVLLAIATSPAFAQNKNKPKPNAKPAASTGPITDAQIDAGIAKLVERLYAQQNKDKLWVDAWPNDKSIHGVQFGGTTALATYALLLAGESYQDPRLARSMKFLREVEMKGVYSRALRAHVYAALPPSSFNAPLGDDVKWLISAAQDSPHGGKLFSYTPTMKGYSNSRTKFGLLGLWQGALRDHAVPSELWTGIEKHYTASQNKDGGWAYRKTGGDWKHSRGTMTAAGLIALHTIQDYHYGPKYVSPGATPSAALHTAIDNGLAWYDKNWVPHKVPETGGAKGGYSNLFYWLYVTERVGEASGIRYFNNKDWYQAGARVVLDQLAKGGKLNPGRKVNSGYQHAGAASETISLSFALMFLSRGRSPTLVHKLEVPDFQWNNRPYDLTHLVHWVTDEFEQPVKWQRVPISGPIKDWLEAPILYLSGSGALELNEAHKAKLKRYIHAGGLLVTTADRADVKFTKSIEALHAELFPAYPLQRIAPDDLLLSSPFQVNTSRLGAMSVHNGVRHLAVHLPRGDVSWALHGSSKADPAPWQLFANLAYHATEGQPRARAADVARIERPSGKTHLNLARVRFDGNWNPEPGAWAALQTSLGGALTLNPTTTDLAELPQSKAPLAHLGGAGAVEWSEADAQAVRGYIDGGGTLLIESIGGDGEFSRAAMGLLRQAFPRDRLRPISLESSVVTGKGIGGYDVSSVQLRDYAVRLIGNIDTPRLMAIVRNGKPVVLFSGEDLSTGMLGQRAWGVIGYRADTARKIAFNVTRYAAQRAGNPNKSEPPNRNSPPTDPVLIKTAP